MPLRLLLAALVLASSGCVERVLVIRTDPPGARVFVDGKASGETPVEIPFVCYGEREIVLEKNGYLSREVLESVRAPWWQVFPFDFITDVLLPIPLRDVHKLEYTLEPFLPARRGFEETKKRAEEFRKKAHEP